MRTTHALDWDACHVRGLAWLRSGRFPKQNYPQPSLALVTPQLLL
jgi:hypothetical protein